MQFASPSYLLFLALAAIVYFRLPNGRLRSVWLLAASYFFYVSLSAWWTVVLVAVTAIGYVGGRSIAAVDRTEPGADRRARRRTTVSVVLVGLVLAAFKYASVTKAVLGGALAFAGFGKAGPVIALALPIGVSFWTFQTISYLVDVYRGRLAPERDLIRYALFIAFFPQVSAGPIARGEQLLPQLSQERTFSFEGMRSGLMLMLWGFFKKTMVADRLGIFVGVVFANPRAWSQSGLVLLAAAVGFAIQIYCDFSGYTDIVRGSARIFGIDLLPNFDRPYLSRSVKEFWRRWHMSLMGWMKEYIYIPLGGSRVSKARRYLNILAVFAFSGIWHGTGITFLVWGLLNGVYQILGEILMPIRTRLLALVHIRPDGRLHRVIQTAFTFLLITIGWVFFRAKTLADATYILAHMFVPSAAFLSHLRAFKIGLTPSEVALTALAAALVFAIDWVSLRVDLPRLIYRQPLLVRSLIYQVMILTVFIFGAYGPTVRSADFVYFKF